MLRWNYVCGRMLLMALLAPLHSQQPVPRQDSSPHATQFVTVDKNVRLEVLDWGGSGRPVILLAGGGNTAHVFDEFAPKLAANYRVYGITRRGFGASTYAPLEEGADRLGEDVLAVVRALKINQPVLVGHSIAGAELSSVATLHPGTIAGVIYLEAAYPYAFDNGQGPSVKEFVEVQGPQPPSPSQSDLASFSALRKWDTQVYGFQLPESEFHQTWDSTPDGRPEKPRDFPGSQSFMTIMTNTKKYAQIPVPVLAIFAIPHVQEAWMIKSADPAVRKDADTYFAKLDTLAEKQAKSFEDGVPGAHVIRLRGMHYVYVSNELDVLREMRSFLTNLK
jgi:pimeloyl-ACP methyl ester carboxylesterase